MQNQEVIQKVTSIIDDAIVHASSIRLAFEYLIEHINNERIAGFYYILADSSEQLENMLRNAIDLTSELQQYHDSSTDRASVFGDQCSSDHPETVTKVPKTIPN